MVNICLGDKCAEGKRRSQRSVGRDQKEERIRNQIAEGKRQRSERRTQKEANKDLQDAINSFIIH